MNNPVISVIIPTLGRISDLRGCLDSLSKQALRNFEILIITDNKDELAHLLDSSKEFNIFILEENNAGLASARNRGLLNAKGRIVTFIDDDVLPGEHWTQELLNSFNNQDVGGVSGPTIIPLEKLNSRDLLSFHNKTNRVWQIIAKIYNYLILENQPYHIGKIFKSGAFSLGANYIESSNLPEEIEVDYLEACNMSFRKCVLDEIGGFSYEYKGIGDWSEPDLAFRVKDAGYRLIFNSKAKVIHNISQKGVFNQRGKDSYQRMLNFINFYFKWIKANTPEKVVRFVFNLLFLNLYWIYKFFQTAKLDWLSGIKGTFCGLGAKLCR